MPMRLTQSAYEQLIREDILWLEANTQATLERIHIIEILLQSIRDEYDVKEGNMVLYKRLMSQC